MSPPTTHAPGRFVFAELNARRAPLGQRFYQQLLGWQARPIHVPPFGQLPQLLNGERTVGSVFIAMGAFAPPCWIPMLSLDPEGLAERVEACGGKVVEAPHQLGSWAQMGEITDPCGHLTTVLWQNAGDEVDPLRPGDLALAELWARDPDQVVGFYEALTGATARSTPLGYTLHLEGPTHPAIAIRRNTFGLTPCWLPLFCSVSVGGDGHHAERLGAVREVDTHDFHGLGRAAYFTDPCGAHFGLVTYEDEANA